MAKSTNLSGKKPKKIYLDYASGVFPNASSIHEEGLLARANLEKARSSVAGVLSVRKEEVIFTSGGTESNNLAIQGALFAQIFSRSSLPRVRGGAHTDKKFEQTSLHIITTNIEHPSVLETFKMLERRKLAEISIVPVEPNGIVDPKKIKKAIKKNTVLVSVMYANNEMGTIQPIREIAKEIRHYKKTHFSYFPVFHTDAVQAGNYLDLNVEKLGVDMLSLSGSKIEGAGRVGVLYKRKSIPLEAIWGGGDQEMGFRPGTENIPAIIKFSEAFLSARKIKDKEVKRLAVLRDYFLHKLQYSHILKNIGISINGDVKNRLPNNVNITVENIPSDLLVIELSARGVSASAKSACKAEDGKASYVIKAINPKIKDTDGSIRFSFGRSTEKKDIDYALKAFFEILTKLKKWYTPTPISS